MRIAKSGRLHCATPRQRIAEFRIQSKCDFDEESAGFQRDFAAPPILTITIILVRFGRRFRVKPDYEQKPHHSLLATPFRLH